MALCVLWILANIFLFNALQVYGSLPIPVLHFEEKIIDDDDTSITCTLPCNDCPDAELSIKGNATLKDCTPRRGHYPNVTCTVEVTREMHEMEFTCEARFKSQSLPKMMLIQIAPEFTDCATDLVWVEGQESSFFCKATGYPQPTVTCEKNNTIYKEGETFTAMRNMSGKFTCRATNFDTDSKSVNVTVEYKPKISSVTVNPPLRTEGDKVEISCEANGVPSPDYNWNTPTDVQLSPDKRVITIGSLKENHLGNYSCTVRNTHGTDHKQVTLDFATKPKISRFLIEPSTQVLMGDNVTLICEASGFPAPVLSLDGPKLNMSPHKGSLTILGVKQAHVGSYTCTARNKYGSDTGTQELTLAVKPKIKEIKPDPSISVTEGTDVTLTCDAKGDPLPNYSWKTPNPQLTSNNSVLNIKNAKTIDEGEYQCTAENKFGQDTMTTKLSVKVPGSTQGNRGDRPQFTTAIILATLIFLFFHLC